jgi:hypothetical protein
MDSYSPFVQNYIRNSGSETGDRALCSDYFAVISDESDVVGLNSSIGLRSNETHIRHIGLTTVLSIGFGSVRDITNELNE